MFKHVSSTICVAIVAAAVLLFTPLRAMADNSGAVEGVVKNSSGQPLAGAYVKLRDAEKRLTFMVISQAQGRYSATNLPPGKYSVQGVGDGFQSSPKADRSGGRQIREGGSLSYSSAGRAARQRLAGQTRQRRRCRNVGA